MTVIGNKTKPKAPAKVDLRRVIGPVEAAEVLGVGRTTIQRWIDEGLIKAHRTPGGFRRIKLSDLLEFARAQGFPVSMPEAELPVILVVDDDPEFLEWTRGVLEAAFPEVRVVCSSSPFEAGTRAVREHPRLVLLDIRMPGMGGIEVCELLHKDPELEDITIFGVTAGGTEAEIEKLRKAGARDVLKKPVDVGHFLKSVQDVLQEA